MLLGLDSTLYHFPIGPADPAALADVAERVRSARLSKYLTQEGLAEASGVGRATITRIEAGSAAPQMRTLKSLAAALGKGLDELVPDPKAIWSRRGT